MGFSSHPGSVVSDVRAAVVGYVAHLARHPFHGRGDVIERAMSRDARRSSYYEACDEARRRRLRAPQRGRRRHCVPREREVLHVDDGVPGLRHSGLRRIHERGSGSSPSSLVWLRNTRPAGGCSSRMPQSMPHPLGRPRVQSAAVPREQPWRIPARATELTGVTPQRWIICTMCWLQARIKPALTARQVEDIARPSRASHPVRQHGKIDTFRPLLAHPITTNAQVRDLGILRWS